jgi:hypothetical protein
VLLKIEMLKHDSSETKTYSADSYRKEENAQEEQRIKEGYRYPGESYYESHRNKLVYTYVLRHSKKYVIR